LEQDEKPLPLPNKPASFDIAPLFLMYPLYTTK